MSLKSTAVEHYFSSYWPQNLGWLHAYYNVTRQYSLPNFLFSFFDGTFYFLLVCCQPGCEGFFFFFFLMVWPISVLNPRQNWGFIRLHCFNLNCLRKKKRCGWKDFKEICFSFSFWLELFCGICLYSWKLTRFFLFLAHTKI